MENKASQPKPLAEASSIPPESLELIARATDNYEGDINILESAIGVFVMAHFTGHAPLRVAHSPVSMRRWGRILGIEWVEYFPEEGPLALRSRAYQAAVKLKVLKAAIHGEFSLRDRRTLTIPK